jgi:hypothetical protein
LVKTTDYYPAKTTVLLSHHSGGQFQPVSGGQFKMAEGGQFVLAEGGQFAWVFQLGAFVFRTDISTNEILEWLNSQ